MTHCVFRGRRFPWGMSYIADDRIGKAKSWLATSSPAPSGLSFPKHGYRRSRGAQFFGAGFGSNWSYTAEWRNEPGPIAGVSKMFGLRIVICSALLVAAISSMGWGQTVGPCRFDQKTLSFSGSAKEQARCLLRPVGEWGRVGAISPSLPPTLEAKVGQPVEVSSGEVRRELAALNLSEAAVGGSLDQPISRGRDGAADAPIARYFVIHDTSAPWLGDQPFPGDIDTSSQVNGLRQYAGADAVAHMFINRRGEMLVGHELSVPWRATKFETQVVGEPAKGIFIHIESVQPRRRDPRGGPKNDAAAPQPGFSPAQYDRLALLYLVTSRRAGIWMLPAFHAVIDEGIPDAHDDPQNFELAKFDAALSLLLTRIHQRAN
jgi:hypothetical protein